MKKIIGLAMLMASGVANAGVIPFGVQNDVSFDQVSNDWGWSLCHVSNYGGSVAIADMFSSCNGDYVMLGAALEGSDTIDTLAAALFTDVTTYTAHNVTTSSNGAEWYFNAYSMGFAGLGDAINQNTADTAGANERDRLSWHTSLVSGSWSQSSAVAPLYVHNGWRSGDNTNIYAGTGWNRLVFTFNSASVPAPAPLALFSLGLIGLAFGRKKKAK